MNVALDTEAGPIPSHSGVLTLTGYGLLIGVRRGRLVVEDSVADERRRLVLSRVGSGIHRFVVLGHSGTVTLEALRWITDIGAVFVQIDRDGRVVAVAGPPGVKDVRVRRGQARALDTGVGLHVARELLSTKVNAQASVSERLPNVGATTDYLRDVAKQLETVPSLDQARYLESCAAAAYWNVWSPIETPFVRGDRKHVPDHWITFGARSSPLTGNQNKAANPCNAMLNYLYAILEAETRLALLAVGCDPGFGIVHVDRTSRDSFALDLMEPVRPHVDAFLLDLFGSRQLSRTDFFEARDGWCRLMPTITRPLAATAPRWAQLVAPIAERVATIFLRSEEMARRAPTPIAVPDPKEYLPTAPEERLIRTPLTRANQRQSARPSFPGTPRRYDDPRSLLPAHCKQCGAKLTTRRRKYCDICLPALEQRPCATGVIRASARRKAAGIRDQRSAPETVAKRWGKIAARQAEHDEWESEHGPGPSRDVFLHELTPRLKQLPVDLLITATGLSKVMCYRIRRGLSVPHWRHWDTIRSAVAAYEATPREPKAWERLPADTYERRIAPFLAAIPTKAVRAATGFSEAYVSLVKHRHYTPHRRHWPALLRVVEDPHPSTHSEPER